MCQLVTKKNNTSHVLLGEAACAAAQLTCSGYARLWAAARAQTAEFNETELSKARAILGLMRFKQIVRDGMLDSYDFEDTASQEIVDYMWEMKSRLRELSLRTVSFRTVLKIADLRKVGEHNWRRLAETTILKRAEVC